MRTTLRFTLGGAAILLVAQIAAAQTIYNPNPVITAPYSRPALSPYLNLLRGGDPAANYYLGVLTEYDRRYRESRIGIPVAEPLAVIDPYVDDRADLDVKDRTLPPTGHQAGFMVFNSYFRVANQRTFIPYNPQQGSIVARPNR
jgi:hypothetical protein